LETFFSYSVKNKQGRSLTMIFFCKVLQKQKREENQSTTYINVAVFKEVLETELPIRIVSKSMIPYISLSLPIMIKDHLCFMPHKKPYKTSKWIKLFVLYKVGLYKVGLLLVASPRNTY